MTQQGSRGRFQVGQLLLNGDAVILTGSGAPTSGVGGAGYNAGPGSIYIRTSNGAVYTNTNTAASPTWGQLGSIAALTSGHIFVGNAGNVGTDVAMSGDASIDNAGAVTVLKINGQAVSAAQAALIVGITNGTVLASKALIADANKAVDTLRATTDLNVGGTGVPGGAVVQTTQTKRVTAYADTTAKDTWTVTVPNAEHNAVIEFTFLGILGAGGTIGEGEASLSSRYTVSLARTAGVNVVAGISAAQDGAIESHVAGGQAITSVVATLSAVAGAVGASNTFTVKIAITRSGAGATNHICVTSARVLNANATGVTIA